MTRRYTNEILPIIGPETDIPAPDVNTTPKVMAWIMDTYSVHMGANMPGVVTGKPLSIGGSQGRNEATGRGCVFVILAAARRLGLQPNTSTVAIEGYGNAGSVAAHILHDSGFRVIAVSDSKGGIINPNGLDPAAVSEHKGKTGSVVGFPGSSEVTNAELIAAECDVLIPAALENEITGENANEVKAKLIAEAANGPTTPDADDILSDRGITVIPDILANAGGVTVSYFEWVQARQAYYWSERQVNLDLRDVMQRAFHDVQGYADRAKCTLRKAALAIAVTRVADATVARGIYP